MADHSHKSPLASVNSSVKWAAAAGLTEGAVLLVVPKVWWPKCPIHAVTGGFCPGCGGQRAVKALLADHLELALRYNALLLALPLFLLALYAVKKTPWETNGRRAVMATAAVCVVAFTIARNLPGSAWAPPA